MADSATGRIMQLEKGRTHVYVSRKIVTDSGWPFAPKEKVALRLDRGGKRLIIEKLGQEP